MNLLREKSKALGQHRAMGGGGGGGGGDGGDGDVGPSDADIGAFADIGMDASGIQGAINAASIGNIGFGQTSPASIGLGAIGMATGLSSAPISGVATIGNAINAATGFSGGTPSTGTGDPGSASSPGGGMATYNPMVSNYLNPGEYFDAQGNLQIGNGQYLTPDQVRMFRPQALAAYQSGGGGVTLGDVAGGRTGGGFGAAPTGGNTQQNFDAAAYLRNNPDVAAAGMDPWVHYTTYGANEGRAFTAIGAPSGGGGGAASTPEDQAIRAAQLELVNQQRDIAAEMLRRQNLLEPELLRSQGYEQVTDASGRVTGYQLSAAARDQQAREAEIANLMRTRTLAALKGELPVDPALNREIDQNRLTLRDALRANLGSGFETSTPGIQALADFEKRAEELREASRRDQLQAGEGIRLAGEQLSSQIGSQRFGNIAGLSQLTGAPAGIFNSAGTGLNAIGTNILGNRQLTLQEILGNLNSRTQLELGRMGSNDLATRLNFQDNAGTGQLFGGIASSLLGTESGRQAVGSAVDWFGSLFS